MIRALIIGAFASLAYTQAQLIQATSVAVPISTPISDFKKPNPTKFKNNNRLVKPKNIIDIPIIKDCDSDQTEEERQQASIENSQNSDCSEGHRKKCPYHFPRKTTDIVGTWSPLNDTKIQIQFDKEGRLSLRGCNINSCSYTLKGRKFQRGDDCIGTKRACQVDNDSLYLNFLKSAKFVISGGKDKLVFLDQHFHKILILYRVQV